MIQFGMNLKWPVSPQVGAQETGDMNLDMEAEGRSQGPPVSGQGVWNVWTASVFLNSGWPRH